MLTGAGSARRGQMKLSAHSASHADERVEPSSLGDGFTDHRRQTCYQRKRLSPRQLPCAFPRDSRRPPTTAGHPQRAIRAHDIAPRRGARRIRPGPSWLRACVNSTRPAPRLTSLAKDHRTRPGDLSTHAGDHRQNPGILLWIGGCGVWDSGVWRRAGAVQEVHRGGATHRPRPGLHRLAGPELIDECYFAAGLRPRPARR